jgi:hypothetical protein
MLLPSVTGPTVSPLGAPVLEIVRRDVGQETVRAEGLQQHIADTRIGFVGLRGELAAFQQDRFRLKKLSRRLAGPSCPWNFAGQEIVLFREPLLERACPIWVCPPGAEVMQLAANLSATLAIGVGEKREVLVRSGRPGCLAGFTRARRIRRIDFVMAFASKPVCAVALGRLL